MRGKEFLYAISHLVSTEFLSKVFIFTFVSVDFTGQCLSEGDHSPLCSIVSELEKIIEKVISRAAKPQLNRIEEPQNDLLNFEKFLEKS